MSALSFDVEKHKYFYGDRQLASVTKILEAVGLLKSGPWFNDPSHRQRGTAVHLACSLIDAGEYDEAGTHPLILPYARQYAAFRADTGFRGMQWEASFAHLDLGFAGTLDVAGLERDRELWLVDIKTGQMPLAASVAPQLAGYEDLVCNGWTIPRPDSDRNSWLIEYRRANPKVKIRRKCLCLPGGDAPKGVLRSFDEPRWIAVWRSAVTIYNIRKEHGLL
jgi:hypothetical protein